MPISADEYRRAAERLTAMQRVLLVSHDRPDGDALGSLIALRSMLRLAGVDARAVTFEFDAAESRYALLSEAAPLARWPDEIGPDAVGELDAIVVVDTCSFGQMESFAEFLRSSPAQKFVVDHHVTGDDIADVYLTDETASAACVLLAEWAEAAGWTINERAALGLFVGMATDTGWFRHSNTDTRTLRAAAALIEAGLRPNEVYQRLYLSDSPGRIRLLGAMLGTLELHADGRFAAVHLTQKMFDASGARPEDTEDLVNEPQRIGSVVAAALFVEHMDGVVKVSLRSKRDIDVAAVAASFGGGGHKRAAGVRVPGTLEEVKTQITRAMLAAMDAGREPGDA